MCEKSRYGRNPCARAVGVTGSGQRDLGSPESTVLDVNLAVTVPKMLAALIISLSKPPP